MQSVSGDGHHRLRLINLARQFGSTRLFRKISFELSTGEIIAVTGWNGSGKSTLLRIIAGLLRASAGKVEMYAGDVLVPLDERRHFVGMVSPALSLYDELTASENLSFLNRVRGMHDTTQLIDDAIRKVGLAGWENAMYGIFSSGMKQRLKIAQALLHHPPLLLLDEPFSNLDSRGIEIVDQIIGEHRQHGMILIASNEEREIQYGDRIVNLSE